MHFARRLHRPHCCCGALSGQQPSVWGKLD